MTNAHERELFLTAQACSKKKKKFLLLARKLPVLHSAWDDDKGATGPDGRFQSPVGSVTNLPQPGLPSRPGRSLGSFLLTPGRSPAQGPKAAASRASPSSARAVRPPDPARHSPVPRRRALGPGALKPPGTRASSRRRRFPLSSGNRASPPPARATRLSHPVLQDKSPPSPRGARREGRAGRPAPRRVLGPRPGPRLLLPPGAASLLPRGPAVRATHARVLLWNRRASPV